ncbi:MAG: phosphoadenylyl-sulfate reductase [Deltaproteobacteria bacterium]|nr:MAG: phosphoadenylyl-sulfate reductase [Deltaproteobacteria bacterium]
MATLNMTTPDVPTDREGSPRLTLSEAASLSERLAAAEAEEILVWAMETFGRHLVVASSFGAEDMVLMDLALRLDPLARVFTIDTGRLPEETYAVMDAARERWGVALEVHAPRPEALEPLVRERGMNLFYRSVADRKACCHVRKVEPLQRALAGAGAWATGLRRGQAVTRSALPVVQVDYAHGGIVKLNPLAAWSEEDVWRAIRERDLPYNALHDRGFPSIGCAPCTRAVQPGEDVRAGRWWWETPETKECGLHVGDGTGSTAA